MLFWKNNIKKNMAYLQWLCAKGADRCQWLTNWLVHISHDDRCNVVWDLINDRRACDVSRVWTDRAIPASDTHTHPVIIFGGRPDHSWYAKRNFSKCTRCFPTICTVRLILVKACVHTGECFPPAISINDILLIGRHFTSTECANLI